MKVQSVAYQEKSKRELKAAVKKFAKVLRAWQVPGSAMTYSHEIQDIVDEAIRESYGPSESKDVELVISKLRKRMAA